MKPSPVASLKNSTNVRFKREGRALRELMPPFFRALGSVSASLAARLAEEIFFTPPRYEPPAPERETLATGHRFTVKDGDREIAAWSWGDGPTVFLVHGWGGRGGQLHALVRPLLAEGYSVVLFDAPAHGETPGRTASVGDFATALAAVVAAAGPAHAIVAHSMGAGAVALAMHRGLSAGRVVFVASPSRFADFATLFGNHLGLSPRALERLKARIERRVGVPFERLSLPDAAPSFRAPLLVLHDRNDQDVPVRCAEEIAGAWPGAHLVVTEGLGHRKILRAPEAIAHVMTFLGRPRD